MDDEYADTDLHDCASKYQRIREVGAGTFAFVELAVDSTTGEEVAIKYLERGPKITKYVERELMNHSCLKHPHVVQFKEVFLTPRYLAIAMEFVPGADLYDHIRQRGRLREQAARWFFQQLILALDYLHSMGVASRDIKAENILLDKSSRPLLKICDFGYSINRHMDPEAASKVGTLHYLAPEVILTAKGAPYDPKLVDTWSCGVLLYVMLVGDYPFARPEDEDDVQRFGKVVKRILSSDYCLPTNVSVSEGCKNLLRRVMVADPRERITIAEIQCHPWFKEGLPPGAMSLSQRTTSPPSKNQSLQDIQTIIQQARMTISKGRVNQLGLGRRHGA